jgi:hypothetical protein
VVQEGNLPELVNFSELVKGMPFSVFQRVLTAILSLHDQVFCWPSAEEKRNISRRFFITYGLPKCIGIIGDTLIFLTESPEWSGEDFNTQKGGYGVNALVVCDDHCRVLYSSIGWPGSTHDNHS